MAAASMTDVPPNFITIMGKPGVSKVQSARFREVEIKRNDKSKCKRQQQEQMQKATARANARANRVADCSCLPPHTCQKKAYVGHPDFLLISLLQISFGF